MLHYASTLTVLREPVEAQVVECGPIFPEDNPLGGGSRIPPVRPDKDDDDEDRMPQFPPEDGGAGTEVCPQQCQPHEPPLGGGDDVPLPSQYRGLVICSPDDETVEGPLFDPEDDRDEEEGDYSPDEMRGTFHALNGPVFPPDEPDPDAPMFGPEPPGDGWDAPMFGPETDGDGGEAPMYGPVTPSAPIGGGEYPRCEPEDTDDGVDVPLFSMPPESPGNGGRGGCLPTEGEEDEDWDEIVDVMRPHDELDPDGPIFPPDDGGAGGGDAPVAALPCEPPGGSGDANVSVLSMPVVFPEEDGAKGGKVYAGTLRSLVEVLSFVELFK